MRQRQAASRRWRRPEASTEASTEAKARENRAFVRALLFRKQPEFALALAVAVDELSRELARTS